MRILIVIISVLYSIGLHSQCTISAQELCDKLTDINCVGGGSQLTESEVDAMVANNGYYDNCADIEADCGFITTDQNTEYKFFMEINSDCEIEYDFVGSDGSEMSETLPLPQTTFSYDDCVFYMNNGCGEEIKIDNRQTYVYEAEDSDNLTDGRYNHSIGNGNETVGVTAANDWGFVVPYDGQITRVAMGNRTTATTASEFQLTLDGALVGSQLVLPASTSSIVWNTTQNVTAGQSINFFTIDGNNISDSAITIYYKTCEQ